MKGAQPSVEAESRDMSARTLRLRPGDLEEKVTLYELQRILLSTLGDFDHLN